MVRDVSSVSLVLEGMFSCATFIEEGVFGEFSFFWSGLFPVRVRSSNFLFRVGIVSQLRIVNSKRKFYPDNLNNSVPYPSERGWSFIVLC